MTTTLNLRMIFPIACLLAGILTFPGTALAEDQRPETSEWIEDLGAQLEEFRQIYQTPGFAIAIVKDGQLIYAKGFGYRDIERQLPVTPDTIFPTASVTKQFTAALIGMEAGQGTLSLSDRPAKFLPELRFRTDEMNSLVTLSDLLSHQSGIGVVDAGHVFFPTNDLQKHMARLPYLTPNSKVRERFDYGNMNYAVLAAIYGRITGQSWESGIESRIFEQLNMTRSSASLASLKASENVAVGYGMIDGQPHSVLYEDQHEAGPSGAINSTAHDLSKWVMMLLNDGRQGDLQIVPKEFLWDAYSAQVMINPTYDPRFKGLGLDGYGYGWFVSEFEGRYRVNHGGNTSGFTARVDMLPGENLGLAVLTNQQSTQFPRYVADIVYRKLLNLPPKDLADYPVQITVATGLETLGDPSKESQINRPLDEFQGTYHNPGYGSFEVSLRKGRLYAVFPAFSFALEHQQNEVFVTKRYYEIHQNAPSFPVNFQSDELGQISGATMPLQADAVFFARQNSDRQAPN